MKTPKDKPQLRLKEWYEQAGRKAGISFQAIQGMHLSGRIKLKLRRDGGKVYVLPPYPEIESRLPREGEIPLKEWIANKAQELHQTFRNVQSAVYRGHYPLEKRHVNAKVVFVKI